MSRALDLRSAISVSLFFDHPHTPSDSATSMSLIAKSSVLSRVIERAEATPGVREQIKRSVAEASSISSSMSLGLACAQRRAVLQAMSPGAKPGDAARSTLRSIARGELWKTKSSGFHSSDADVSADLRRLGPGSDAHVHYGACLTAVDYVLELGSTWPKPRMIDRARVVHPLSGVLIDLVPLALGVSTAVAIVRKMMAAKQSTDSELDQADVGIALRDSIRARELWERVWIESIATSPVQVARSITSEFGTEAAACVSAVHGSTEFCEVIETYMDEVLRARGSELFDYLMGGAWQALVLMNAILFPEPKEGLEGFTRAFAAAASIRDSSFANQSKLAEGSILALGDLANLELRRTVDWEVSGSANAASPAKGAKALAASITQMLEGAYLAIGAGAASLSRLEFPISFRRESCGIESPSSAIYHSGHSLAGVWRIVRAWDVLRREDPELTTLVSSFDVVGYEGAALNWPFACAYEEIEARAHGSTPTFFSIHAGESFFLPSSGVRRIYEALHLFSVHVARIGHALALDYDPVSFSHTKWKDRLANSAPLEIVRDLATIVVAGGETGRQADAVLRELLSNSHVYGAYYQSSVDIAKAARLPFSTEFWEGMGLLRGVGAGTMEWSRDEVMPAMIDGSSAESRLALLLAIRGGNADSFASVFHSANLDSIALVLEEGTVALVKACWETISNSSVVVESCPTSNLVTLEAPAYDELPIRRWLGDGRPITVSTDDPGLFGTSLSEEYLNVFARAPYSVESLEAVWALSEENCCLSLTAAGLTLQSAELKAIVET